MLLVKIGGAKNINYDNIAKDILELSKTQKVVVVHGASQTRDEIASALGHPTREVISPSGVTSVYIDPKSLEIFLMAYPGLVNKQIVAIFQKHGINSVGLSGIDGKIWEGERKPKILSKDNGKIIALNNNHSGKITKINTQLIEILLENNFVPVICSPAITTSGEIINTDNDTAVAMMVKPLQISKIVYLFDAPGLMKDIEDPNSMIREISYKNIENYYEYAQGRMLKKVMSAKLALENGASKVYLGNVKSPNPIISALNGQSTIIS
jgi:[amino group carrier protein]-L-2-aminoadipate 6-kinase